jgi:hypothetical protein
MPKYREVGLAIASKNIRKVYALFGEVADDA